MSLKRHTFRRPLSLLLVMVQLLLLVAMPVGAVDLSAPVTPVEKPSSAVTRTVQLDTDTDIRDILVDVTDNAHSDESHGAYVQFTPPADGNYKVCVSATLADGYSQAFTESPRICEPSTLVPVARGNDDFSWYTYSVFELTTADAPYIFYIPVIATGLDTSESIYVTITEFQGGGSGGPGPDASPVEMPSGVTTIPVELDEAKDLRDDLTVFSEDTSMKVAYISFTPPEDGTYTICTAATLASDADSADFRSPLICEPSELIPNGMGNDNFSGYSFSVYTLTAADAPYYFRVLVPVNGLDETQPATVTITMGDIGPGGPVNVITTEEQLRQFAEDVNGGNSYAGARWVLGADVALTEDWIPIGTSTTSFCGTFDGCGYTISNLKASGDCIGLFGYVGSGAELKNITLTDINMSGQNFVSGLVAYVDAGTGSVSISNCSISGTVYGRVSDDEGYYGDNTGGIAACVNAESGSVIIENCTASGSVIGDSNFGGILGDGNGVSGSLIIRNCTNYSRTGRGNATHSGGIAGSVSGAQISQCSNYGEVTGNSTSEDHGSAYFGGIAGYASDCEFLDCANHGDITAWYAGGIAGYVNSSTFTNCLNTGTLTWQPDPPGYGYGIAKANNGECTYTNCYSTSRVFNTGVSEVTIAQLASGEICYLLNNNGTGTTWRQDLGTDAHPVFSGPYVYFIDGAYVNSAEVQVLLPENTAASITAPSGGWIEGTNTFFVSSDTVCYVAVSYDGGQTYTRLEATAGENGYSFTADMDANTIVAVVAAGDMDGDGSVSAADCTSVQAMLLGKVDGTALQILAADVNGDGEITAAEFNMIRAVVLGKTPYSW